MDHDIYISYTSNGFYHSFSAVQDINDSNWDVHFLVMHCTNRNKMFIGEYTKFRKHVFRKLANLPILTKTAIHIEIDRAYRKVLQSYLYRYINRINHNLPVGENLYDFGTKMINKLQIIIDKYKLKLLVTRVYQPDKVSFHFTWGGDIIASYSINKFDNTYKFEETEF